MIVFTFTIDYDGELELATFAIVGWECEIMSLLLFGNRIMCASFMHDGRCG